MSMLAISGGPIDQLRVHGIGDQRELQESRLCFFLHECCASTYDLQVTLGTHSFQFILKWNKDSIIGRIRKSSMFLMGLESHISGTHQHAITMAVCLSSWFARHGCNWAVTLSHQQIGE